MDDIRHGIYVTDAGTRFRAVSPISCSFEPLPDITAYELAQILPYCHGRIMWESDWEALGSAQRHLKRMDGGSK